MPDKPPSPAGEPPRRGRFERFVRTMWWLHSLWALTFGVGVMIYARKGLAHADKLLIVLAVSWLVVFGALRFIVGPDNVKPDDKFFKKGLRLGTNYIIKNLYQQMLFFLVPLYASSTTWSMSASNWWLAPVLLLFAVLSTMDLVMDEYVMQRRMLASVMYAFCMFGVLNLILPIATDMTHFQALLVSAASAVPAVALLTFRVRQIITFRGLAAVITGTVLLTAGAWYRADVFPPAPLALSDGAVSHGTPGSYEEVPGHKDMIPASQLDGLRCVTRLTKPGDLVDEIHHVWGRGDRELVVTPERITGPNIRGFLFRSYAPQRLLDDPVGAWTCTVVTDDHQLVGRLAFEIR